MKAFESWLVQMATAPLPGGVAAAALAAAMGAALVTKVVRAGTAQQPVGSATQGPRQSLLHLAQVSRARLLDLAAADVAAYQQVLDTWHLPADDEARLRAWQGATDAPLSLAEVCQRLLAELPRSEELAAQPVAADLEIGRSLLQVGAEAGMLAARENLSASGTHGESSSYYQRLDALSGENQE